MKHICFEVESKEELLNEIDELIKKNLAALNFAPPDNSLMTRKEVAEYFSVSLPTIHSWIKTGLLKSYRIGNTIKFKKGEVIAALKPRRFMRG